MTLSKVPVLDFQKQEIGTFPVHYASQVIDIPPVWKDTKWVQVAPILILKNEEKSANETWVIAHEVIHLLSIGPYIQVNKNQWTHHFGINEYIYQTRDNIFHHLNKKCHSEINELITDYIAWNLTQKLYGPMLPRYSKIGSLNEYLKVLFANEKEISKLIGWYFIGDTDRIHKLLTDTIFGDYKKLYNELQNYLYTEKY